MSKSDSTFLHPSISCFHVPRQNSPISVALRLWSGRCACDELPDVPKNDLHPRKQVENMAALCHLPIMVMILERKEKR